MSKQVSKVFAAVTTALEAVIEAQDHVLSFKGKGEILQDLEDAGDLLATAKAKVVTSGFRDWRLVYRDGQGHRLFFCAIAGRYSIADQSADDSDPIVYESQIGRPDETDDGVLWIDPNRPCVIRAFAEPGVDEPMTYQQRHPGVDVPVIDKDGNERNCGVILEFFLDGMLKKAEMRPEVVVDASCRHIYDLVVFCREESLTTLVKATWDKGAE